MSNCHSHGDRAPSEEAEKPRIQHSGPCASNGNDSRSQSSLWVELRGLSSGRALRSLNGLYRLERCIRYLHETPDIIQNGHIYQGPRDDWHQLRLPPFTHSLRTFFLIFPVLVLGSSGMTSTSRGTMNLLILLILRAQSMTSFPSSCFPCLTVMNALGRSPQ